MNAPIKALVLGSIHGLQNHFYVNHILPGLEGAQVINLHYEREEWTAYCANLQHEFKEKNGGKELFPFALCSIATSYIDNSDVVIVILDQQIDEEDIGLIGVANGQNKPMVYVEGPNAFKVRYRHRKFIEHLCGKVIPAAAHDGPSLRKAISEARAHIARYKSREGENAIDRFEVLRAKNPLVASFIARENGRRAEVFRFPPPRRPERRRTHSSLPLAACH